MLIVQQHSIKKRLRTMLAGRERVRASDFGSRYYPDATKADIATFIIEKLEELTDYDFTGALPNDRVAEDLHLGELDSMVQVEIIVEVERRFEIKVLNAEARLVKTIDDFVELIFRKVTPQTLPSGPALHGDANAGE